MIISRLFWGVKHVWGDSESLGHFRIAMLCLSWTRHTFREIMWDEEWCQKVPSSRYLLLRVSCDEKLLSATIQHFSGVLEGMVEYVSIQGRVSSNDLHIHTNRTCILHFIRLVITPHLEALKSLFYHPFVREVRWNVNDRHLLCNLLKITHLCPWQRCI